MPPTNPKKPNQFLHSTSAFATRRRFLQVSAAAASGVILSNCARNLGDPSLSQTGGSSPSPASNDGVLRIYGWANYTDDALLQDFTQKTGIKVTVDTYDSNETMLAKMQAGGGNAYSIIYPSDYIVSQMVDLKMLTTLDKSRIKGLEAMKKQWQDPIYDKGNTYSVPVSWGTTGIIYDPERAKADIKGWDHLWDNKGSLTRRVTLLNDVREVMGATLLYLGHSLNTENPEEIKAAYDQLVELKPAVAAFLTNGWEDQLASGDVTFSMAYSQDAFSLMRENSNLRYVIPETGASLWTDTLVIPQKAPNPDAAYEWINYMLDPVTSAKVVERLKFATPNQVAFDKLPANIKNNPGMFPPDSVLSKCEGIAPVAPETAKAFDDYWTQLTSA
jgi:spermidine/putrescine transport system substrate-binding protein